jgi:hypothetical protein
MPRALHREVHFIVENLVVPRAWRVGRSTIRPKGSLLRRLDNHLQPSMTTTGRWIVEEYRRELGASEWATIGIPMLVPDGKIDESIIDAARELARDTIAVLRFFQRRLVPYFSLEYQTFGLDVDIGSVLETRWVTDRRGAYAASGWKRHGVIGGWTFTPAHLATYASDARFAYLDAALRASVGDEWQGRFLTALRTMNIATIRERPSIRIMLLATALEAFLGDAYKRGRSARGRGDQLARRAAYLSCGGEPGGPGLHRPGGRLACGILTTTSDPRDDPTLYWKAAGIWGCSEYGDVRGLYEDRNAALHGAAVGFDQRAASTHQFRLDRVILEGLSWVINRRPSAITDLDREIACLPSAP